MTWFTEKLGSILGSLLSSLGNSISDLGIKVTEPTTKPSRLPHKKTSTTNKSGQLGKKIESQKQLGIIQGIGNNAFISCTKANYPVYEKGLKGISFPFTLKINNRNQSPISVSAKFASRNGYWIKSKIREFADENDDAFLCESFFVDSNSYIKNSYLFLPFGLLDIAPNQEISIKINVFSNKGSGEFLMSLTNNFVYPFEVDSPPQRVPTANKDDLGQIGVEELIGLIAILIRADNVIAPEEIQTVEDFFNSSKQLTNKVLLRQRLDYNLANPPDLNKCCKILKEIYSKDSLLIFMALLCNISASDNTIPQEELQFLKTISDLWDIDADTFNSLKNSILREKPSLVQNDLWKILGISPTKSKSELKKAYFEKCKQYHPDKFSNATEEKRKEAEEMFKNVNAAYNQLLREI